MAGAQKGRQQGSAPEAGRRIAASDATWHALDELARELGISLDELAEEAFADLLRKHRRPLTLREALRASARQYPANDCEPAEVSSHS